jgi:hypothetical protein
MERLRIVGAHKGGHAAYGARENQRLAIALDRPLTRAMRATTN